MDDYFDIEDELIWEERQKVIASRVSKFEKSGWGYSNFKKYVLENFYTSGSEESFVDDFQSFILQDKYDNVPEWALTYYGTAD
jgi:hypothetical protein